MNGSTGPGFGPAGRYLFATTPYGSYHVLESWAERRMPTLRELAQFLTPAGGDFAWWLGLMRVMVAAEPEERKNLADVYKREDYALRIWQRFSGAPAFDAHGPTMAELLDALDQPETAP